VLQYVLPGGVMADHGGEVNHYVHSIHMAEKRIVVRAAHCRNPFRRSDIQAGY